MDCKAAVEGAPKAIKENADKKTSEELKKKLEEAGAKVSIKPAG
jgi:large subunit ribosomal protein L7/L12